MMNNTGLDLNYRIYSHPTEDIPHQIEAMKQVSRIKGEEYYKEVIHGSLGKPCEAIVKRHARKKLLLIKVVSKEGLVTILIAILGILLGIAKILKGD